MKAEGNPPEKMDDMFKMDDFGKGMDDFFKVSSI